MNPQHRPHGTRPKNPPRGITKEAPNERPDGRDMETQTSGTDASGGEPDAMAGQPDRQAGQEADRADAALGNVREGYGEKVNDKILDTPREVAKRNREDEG
jgi:hypothetical protein